MPQTAQELTCFPVRPSNWAAIADQCLVPFSLMRTTILASCESRGESEDEREGKKVYECE